MVIRCREKLKYSETIISLILIEEEHDEELHLLLGDSFQDLLEEVGPFVLLSITTLRENEEYGQKNYTIFQRALE